MTSSKVWRLRYTPPGADNNDVTQVDVVVEPGGSLLVHLADSMASLEAQDAEQAARLATLRRRTAEDTQAAEAAEASAAAQREAIANAELRIVAAEDLLNLTPRDRNVRRVARMIAREGAGSADNISLATIQSILDVSSSSASTYRMAAAELIEAGYTPADDPLETTAAPPLHGLTATASSEDGQARQ